MKKVYLSVVMLLTATTALLAQETKTADQNWQSLGETTVNFKANTEEIIVRDGVDVKAIKLQVADAPLYLDSFDIHFADGKTKTILYGGFEPMSIDKYGDGIVTKITVRYKAIDSFDKKARVKLLGLKTSDNMRQDTNIAAR